MIRTWRGTIGLAMLAAPGSAAAMALMSEHHRSVWSRALVATCALGGFFLLTWGGERDD